MNSKEEKGFTLLEIMLVILLIGLVGSIATPYLLSNNSPITLEKQARKLNLQINMAIREALLNGQDIGLQLMTDSYRFVSRDKGQWQPITSDRYLIPTELDQTEWFFTPGASHWLEALDYERSMPNTLLADDPEPGDYSQPDIYFWSSGEVSPANITLCPGQGKAQCWQLFIEETGHITMFREDSA